MATIDHYERSRYEAVLDVRYGVRFNELNERFYRRMDLVFGFVGLFGGTAVVTAAAGQWPVLGAIAGVAVAAAAVLERLIRPVEKAISHAEHRRAYADLDARAVALDLAAIDAELRRLQAACSPGIAALGARAYNINLRSNGREDAAMAETRWQRFLAVFA